MALTMNMTTDKLSQELAKAAFVEIEAQIKAELTRRIQPLIDEAAREAAKLIKPVVVSVNRDLMLEKVNVTLVVNNHPPEDIPW